MRYGLESRTPARFALDVVSVRKDEGAQSGEDAGVVIPIGKSEPLSIGKAEPLEDLGPIRKTRRVPSYCSARGERRGVNLVTSCGVTSMARTGRPGVRAR